MTRVVAVAHRKGPKSAPAVAKAPAVPLPSSGIGLLADREDVHAWLARRQDGAPLEYFRGNLVLDRTVGSRLGHAERDELNRVANLAMTLAGEGRVHLVQRRNGPGDYSYLAVSARRTDARRAA